MTSILAESRNYILTNSYEQVFLTIKNTSKKIYIGDFYGDPQDAMISPSEDICIIVGYGIIIYKLEEPFEEYEYNKSSGQWNEHFRENNNEIFFDSIEIVDDYYASVIPEDNNKSQTSYKITFKTGEVIVEN